MSNVSSADSNAGIQALPSSSIILFHPGSRNLKFGRASDVKPQQIIHAIARRRIKTEGSQTTPGHQDLLFPSSLKVPPPPEVESARLHTLHLLQTSLKVDGSQEQRYATPTQQIASFNKRTQGEVLSPKYKKKWIDTTGINTLFGEDVFNIDPNEDFYVHFPWRRGALNLHKGIGGSLTSVLTDLENIWGLCVEKKLGIPLKDLKQYRAVVILPVIYDRSHAREIMDLILNRLGFGGAFLIQDHVCTTFGVGLSIATVVDVGAQKISVSCVEDGISIPESRIEMKYGGDDLSLAFHNLLNLSAVPFKIDFKSSWDLHFLSNLKEKYCHFDLNRCGPEEIEILWEKPEDSPIRYNILLADELLIIPLGLFNPDLLKGSIGLKPILARKALELSYDPHDSVLCAESSRRGLRDTEVDAELDDIDETKENESSYTSINKIDSDSLLGLDQAILQSIESSNMGDELKRRFYSTIIVVGDGFKFNGLASWLQNKIIMGSPNYKSENPEIITQLKDEDNFTWKGGSILCTFETAQELWIKQSEWRTSGSRLIRERSLYQF